MDIDTPFAEARGLTSLRSAAPKDVPPPFEPVEALEAVLRSSLSEGLCSMPLIGPPMVWPRERPSPATISSRGVVGRVLEALDLAGETDEESGGLEDDGVEEVTKRSNRFALSREYASFVVMKRFDFGGFDM